MVCRENLQHANNMMIRWQIIANLNILTQFLLKYETWLNLCGCELFEPRTWDRLSWQNMAPWWCEFCSWHSKRRKKKNIHIYICCLFHNMELYSEEGLDVQKAMSSLTVKTPCHKPISFLQSNTLTRVSPKMKNMNIMKLGFKALASYTYRHIKAKKISDI